MEDDYAIGLYLGTSFSCIGVCRKGGVEIIPNSILEKTTPSVLLFKGEDILVGEETINMFVNNNENYIYEVKRLIGINYDDYKSKINNLKYKIIKSDKKYINIQVKRKGKLELFSPIELILLIIKKLITNAEYYLLKKIKKLVITVPSYYNQDQRNIMRQAIKLLGLEVIRIINDQIAAISAYDLTKERLEDKKVMIFHLGGATFDVSILGYENEQKINNFFGTKNLEILSNYRDDYLGGKDFDNALVEYIINKYNIPKEIQEDSKNIKYLKDLCENIKKILGVSEEVNVKIDNFYNNIDINEKITLKKFEEICKPLLKRLVNTMTKLFSDNNIFPKDIKEVILTGGSTRIPIIKNMIKDFFSENKEIKINDSINPEEVVAYGAALESEKILYNHIEIMSNLDIFNMVPFSLGISVPNRSKDLEYLKEGDEMKVFIKRGTLIPCIYSQDFYTTYDNQTEFSLKIYEGENKYVKYNHLLKEIKLEGLKPRPKGETKIVLDIEVNLDNIVKMKIVEAYEEKGKSANFSISNEGISFSIENIKSFGEKIKKLSKFLNYKELTNNLGVINIKKILMELRNKYNDFFKKEKNEDNKKLFLFYFIDIYEEFLNAFLGFYTLLFDDIILEKFYLYVKILFQYYLKFNEFDLSQKEKIYIFNQIKKYLEIFIEANPYYLKYSLDILSPFQKEKKLFNFNYLILFIIEKLNNSGMEYIKNEKEFSKYHSLKYFELSLFYYNMYLSNANISVFDDNSLAKLITQKKIIFDYINDIKSGGIIFSEKNLHKDKLYDINSKTFSAIGNLIPKNMEYYNNNKTKASIILKEFENILFYFQNFNEITEKEAICIANIININNILGLFNKRKKYLFYLANRCNYIINVLKLYTNKQWCKDYEILYKKLELLKNEEAQDYQGNKNEIILNQNIKLDVDNNIEYYNLFKELRKLKPFLFEKLDILFKKEQKDVKLKDIPFYLYCKTCKNMPGIILKDKESLLITCNNCGIIKSEKLINFSNFESEWISNIECQSCKSKNILEKKSANSFCKICELYLCQECKEKHSNNHELFSLLFNNNYEINLCQFCETLTSYYCFKCNYEFCELCLDSHKNHDFITIKDRNINKINGAIKDYKIFEYFLKNIRKVQKEKYIFVDKIHIIL